MTTNTFDPSKVILAINDYQITGFIDGAFIEVIQNAPYFRNVPGIRGKATRVRSRDRTGTVNIRLMQTSPDNEVLSKLVEQDDIHQSGLLLATLRDVGGQSGLQFGGAYIEGPPNINYSSAETSLRGWRLHYQFITRYYVGGNESSLLDLF
jgi:hypothetical protein